MGRTTMTGSMAALALLASIALASACGGDDASSSPSSSSSSSGGSSSGGSSSGSDASADASADATEEVAASPDYAVSITPPTITSSLGTESHFAVKLTPTAFSGAVTLSTTGLPQGWTATFTPPSPTVTAGTPTDVDLAIAVPASSTGATAAIQVNATAMPGDRSATTSLTIENKYVFTIANGTGAGAHGFPTITLKSSTTLVVKNDDTTMHAIHLDNPYGHQPEPGLAQGGEYVQSPGGVGDGQSEFYCHSHGPANEATITVIP